MERWGGYRIMASQKTHLYYVFLILFIVIAFIIVVWRSWVSGVVWWEYLWKPGEVIPKTRPALSLPWEIQVLLMIVIIIAGIVIAVEWHKHVAKK
jgi:hypothetical protein